MPHPSIGFIGLGIMGEGMASRLISQGVAGSKEGVPLVVYNRTASKCDDLISRYPNDNSIVAKRTAREVVECCS
jgi:3-hydroxyisobutyrate dehydrogenase-like beta-hydroxyacid dehydrogenase